jgi:hypothetical protein
MKIQQLIDELTKIAKEHPNVEVKMSYYDNITRLPGDWDGNRGQDGILVKVRNSPSFIRDIKIDIETLIVGKCVECNFEVKSTRADPSGPLAGYLISDHCVETGHSWHENNVTEESDCIFIDEVL